MMRTLIEIAVEALIAAGSDASALTTTWTLRNEENCRFGRYYNSPQYRSIATTHYTCPAALCTWSSTHNRGAICTRLRFPCSLTLPRHSIENALLASSSAEKQSLLRGCQTLFRLIATLYSRYDCTS